MTGPYRQWSREQLERTVADLQAEQEWGALQCWRSRKLGFGLGVGAVWILLGLFVICSALVESITGGADDVTEEPRETEEQCETFCGRGHYVSVDLEAGICRCSSDNSDEPRVYEHDMTNNFRSDDREVYEVCRRFCGPSYMGVDYENERCVCVDRHGDVPIVRSHPLQELDPCFGPGVTSAGRVFP